MNSREKKSVGSGSISGIALVSAFVLLFVVQAWGQVPQQDEPQKNVQNMSARERRAQAYAKLLEGQRFYSSVTQGDVTQNLKAAQKAFREALTYDPKLIEAYASLAEVELYLEEFDQAAADGEAARQINPDNLGAQRVLSRIYSIRSGLREGTLNAEFSEKAIRALREVIRLEKTDAEAWALLSQFYTAQGKTDEAVDALKHWSTATPAGDTRFYRYFSQGKDLSPDSASAQLAQVLMGAGRNTEAIAAARAALAENPDSKEYGELLAQALDASGGGSPAVIAELQQLVTHNPANTTLVRSLAHAQARAGNVDAAAQTLRAAIAKQPSGERDDLLLRIDLAQTYADALRFDEATTVYEEMLKQKQITEGATLTPENKRFAGAVLQRIIALQKSAEQYEKANQSVLRMRRLTGDDDPSSYLEQISLLNESGKRTEALAVARAARVKFPANNEVARAEAEALTSLGRVDEAVELMKPRLKGTLNDFSVLLTISNFYSEAGRAKEAVDYAKHALSLVPPARTDLASVALISLASAQERAGDSAGAESSLRQVLKNEPNNATALNNLGYFLVERNERLNEAVRLIQEAVKREPANGSYLDSLGWAYFRQGDLKQAEKYLTEAARRSPTSATINEHLGELFLKAQKRDAALVSFRKARSLSVDRESSQRLDAKIKLAEKR